MNPQLLFPFNPEGKTVFIHRRRRNRLRIAVAFCVLAFLFLAQPLRAMSESSECRLFVLKKTAEGYAIEAISINDNGVIVLPINKSSDIISLILPYAPGRSGDFVRLSDAHLVTVHYVQGEIRVKVRKPDNTERSMPTLKAADLKRFDVRVNVTGTDSKKAFFIRGGERVEPDDTGPVLDMFKGTIPIGPGDYSLVLEITERRSVTSVDGEARLEFVPARRGTGGYLLTKVQSQDGPEEDFVVDLGAAKTLVSKSFLPKGVEIKEATAVEYSGKGKRIVKYPASGAGGTVEGLAFAKLPELRIGSLIFPNPSVIVVSELPPTIATIGSRKISGIVGLDLLKQAGIVSFSYLPNASAPPKLILSDKATSAPGKAIELPFTIVGDHIVVKGRILETPVHFILDTGSPDCLISTSVGRATGVYEKAKAITSIRGLDGKPIEAKSVEIDNVLLESNVFSAVPFVISDLPVFKSLGIQETTALLGNSFLKRFQLIQLDFASQTLRVFQ
jgi:predicted aspartyl protease